MGLRPGHRFSVAFEDVFPYGAYLTGQVEPTRDYDAKGKDDQKRDKNTGERVWQARAMDADPEVRRGEFTVKFVAAVQPVPPEAMAGTPFRPVEFLDLAVTPYVEDKSGRMAYSFYAAGMRAPNGGRASKQSTTPAAGQDGARS